MRFARAMQSRGSSEEHRNSVLNTFHFPNWQIALKMALELDRISSKTNQQFTTILGD